MITGFGVKNFKRFQDSGTLPLSGATIFVGPNSSGKSSLIKALILLKDNICNRAQSFFIDKEKIYFDFNSISFDDVNLGTFNRVVYDKTNEDYITMCMCFGWKEDNRRIELDIKRDAIDETQGYISRVRVIDCIKGIKRVYDFDINTKIANVTLHYKLYIEARTSFLRNRRAHFGHERDIWKDLATDMLHSDIRHTSYEKRADVNSQIKNLDNIQDIEINLDTNESGTISDLDWSLPVDHGYVSINVPFTLEIQGDLITSLIYGIKRAKDNINHSYAEVNKGYSASDIVIENSRKMNKSFHDKILDSAIPHIEYIYAHNISKRVFFSINDRNDYISRTLHEVYQTRALRRTEPHDFLKYWMEKFGIGSDVKINRIEGEGYNVKIVKKDGSTKNLVDIGTGSAQIVLLLLKISVILATQQSSSVLVIIEEPEQNMHPNYQSLLADLFYAIHKYGIRMIVETHSEYMIRRSQVLVAQLTAQNKYTQEELDHNCPFRVLYFPEDGMPYDMHYKVNGDFEQLFGEGFFDAAALNRIELYKMQLANNK
ncbi:MAG: AAA family ATPase [Bacteroidales bacterium]|nr:AAA family ATPase [Bacteroidales bacterium]